MCGILNLRVILQEDAIISVDKLETSRMSSKLECVRCLVLGFIGNFSSQDVETLKVIRTDKRVLTI